MAKDDMIEVEGVVTESLPNTTFHVDIGNGHIILAHIFLPTYCLKMNGSLL